MTQKQRYYIGDLCYVMHDVWDEVCNLAFPEDRTEYGGFFTLEDGRQFAIYGTAYGDGEYFDGQGKRYSVDSGTIGMLLADDIRDEIAYLEGGNFHEFENPLNENCCGEENGEIWFGSVCINTADSPEDDEYEEEEDCEDDNSYYED